MSDDEQRDSVNPSEQRGGSTPGEQEAREKGPWAAKAAEGVVPAELGGSDRARRAARRRPRAGQLGARSHQPDPMSRPPRVGST